MVKQLAHSPECQTSERENIMSDEVTQLLIKMLEKQDSKIDNLEKKVDELIALKNKLIAGGVVLSAIFGYLWDFFKNFFGGKCS